MKNQIHVDSTPRNYYGGFILIKPTKPFYKVGEDYQLLSFPENQIVAKARLVMKRTYHISKLPDVVSIMSSDLKAKRLASILRNQSNEVFYDALVFSSNAHYNDWYNDKPVEAVEMRLKEQQQINMF
jgi:hypothetical protein